MNALRSIIQRHGVTIGTMIRMTRDPAAMRLLKTRREMIGRHVPNHTSETQRFSRTAV
ncbi:MAG: hypothetical protein HY360_04590 [Verrucomicrobia bacterium]|nr:hypothetical protein [Verrucomicrobiota bacterium]